MASSHTNLAARFAAVLANAVSSGGGVPPGSGQPHGARQQQPCSLELHGHVGQLPLQALQVGQRPAPDDPLVHVAHRVLQRPLRGADAHRRVAAALVVEVREQHLERVGVRGVPRRSARRRR